MGTAGHSFGEILHQVVVCNTAGNDGQSPVLSWREAVVRVLRGIQAELLLVLDELFVADAGVGGKEDPLLGIVGKMNPVLGADVLTAVLLGPGGHLRPGMGHTGGDAHQHGNLHLLGVVKCLPHHVVGFLLSRESSRNGRRSGNPVHSERNA